MFCGASVIVADALVVLLSLCAAIAVAAAVEVEDRANEESREKLRNICTTNQQLNNCLLTFASGADLCVVSRNQLAYAIRVVQSYSLASLLQCNNTTTTIY